jgi:thioesterase domain-containing protein
MNDDGFDALLRRVATLSPEERARLEGRLTAARGSATSSGGGADEVVVAVRAEGEGWPLFLAVPSAGTLLQVRLLTDRLEAGFPVFAVVPPERDIPIEGAALRLHLVEEATAAIRRVRQHGPYVLGGFCLGGVYALEVARALVADGEQVATCLLLDAPYPQRPARRRAARLSELVGHHLRGIVAGGPGGAARYVAARLRRIGAFLAGARAKRDWLERAVREDPSLAASLRAFRDVPLSPVEVPLVHLVARDGMTRGGERRRHRRWARLAPAGLVVTEVPGAHDTLFEPENLGALSLAVERAIKEAARVPGLPGSSRWV